MFDSSLFSTPAMLAVFSPEAHVRSMLAFEAALAQAQARVGMIPQEAAEHIGAACQQVTIDISTLYAEAALAGTPAIPLVRMLTARLAGEARNYVHWGATSQDVIDTALMLQMRDAMDLLIAGLLEICTACATLAEQHRHTLMVGRTLMQQALPMTFGLKAARWLALALRQIQALRQKRGLLCVQLGGAAGTLAAFGEKGVQVVTLLAEELSLAAPDLPWHTERDQIVEIATGIGVLAGSITKIAHDIILLAQTEIGEVSEGTAPGKGGSSAMPHKQNQVDAINAIAAARLALGEVPVLLSAMMQEHERAAGGWQAEWIALPNLFHFAAGAVEGCKRSLSNLQVDAVRMQANLDLTGGLVMAESLTMVLASHVGKPEAYRIVQTLCQVLRESGKDLEALALQDAVVRAHLVPEEIHTALDPAAYLGSSDIFIDHALALYQKEKSN
jgi:3-carboxy-cis,cis-muconate cycloisomerase